jgi:tRNA nucleotidyltransferase (CCA-adding enzyme)
MNESRPLPMGRQEFEEWSERIISGALLKGKVEVDDAQVFIESQKFALANMLMHLGPTESHKPDAFFIHSLRKFAINQVADTIRKELHEAAKARTAAEEAKNKELTMNETH